MVIPYFDTHEWQANVKFEISASNYLRGIQVLPKIAQFYFETKITITYRRPPAVLKFMLLLLVNVLLIYTLHVAECCHSGVLYYHYRSSGPASRPTPVVIPSVAAGHIHTTYIFIPAPHRHIHQTHTKNGRCRRGRRGGGEGQGWECSDWGNTETAGR